MDPLTPNTSSSRPNIEGVRFLKVINKDLAIQALQQILRDLPEIERSRLSDSIQKNSVIVLSKEYGASLHNFPPGAVVEDLSTTASKVSGISESFNTTNNHNVTASGEHSFAAGKVVFKDCYIYMGEPLAQPDLGLAETMDPISFASEIKAALGALYTSENFKTIRRLVDPTKSLSISESFIRLAVVLEKDFERAQKEVLDENKGDSTRDSDVREKDFERAQKEVLDGKKADSTRDPDVREKDFERAQKEVLDGKKADSTRDSDSVYLNSHEAIMQPKELIETGKLFEYSNLDKLTPSRLLAVGAAGVGKSILCQYIANTWAEHPEKLGDWKSKFDYLFLIRLRDLASYSSIPTLAEVVQKSLRDLSVESIESILSTCGDKTLFLLDGYDEVASWLSQNEEKNAFFRELLRQPHWILTTRPNYFNVKVDSYNCRKLEILGFTRNDVKKYIDQFFKDSCCPEKARLIHKLIASNSRIAALSHIPINLELLCSVWKMKNAASTQPYTMTRLYGEISGFLFERYINEKLGENIQGITLNYLAGNKQYSPLLEAMENIAWKGLWNPKASVILEKRLYEPLISAIINAEGTPKEIKKTFYSVLFNELGFFRTVPSFENSKHPHLVDYYFIHLTFQEYFAARYFVRKFFQSGVQGEEWKECLNDMKFNPKFGVVLWFIAGLLGERVHDFSDSRNAARAAKGALNAFIKCLISQPRSLLGSHELALAMHCSEELEGVTVPCQQEVLEEFVVKLRNLVSGKMGEFRKKSCVTLFQGIRKFYFMDTGQNILKTIRQIDFYRAVDVVTDFQLLAPGVIEFLIKKMKDRSKNIYNWDTAAGALGQIQLEEETLEKVAEALIQRLGDENSAVRKAAAYSLGQLQLDGKTLAKVAEALIQRLGDENSDVQKVAAQSFGQLQLEGETQAKVVEVLVERLRGEDIEVSSEVVESLGNLQLEGEALAKIAQAFIQRLGDENRFVRIGAAESLGKLQLEGETQAKVVEVLVERLRDENSYVRSAVAYSLHKFQVEGETLEKVAEALIQTLEDKDSFLRIAAARLLGELQVEGETLAKVVGALIQRLGYDDCGLFVVAAESLAKLQMEGETLGKVAWALIQRLRDEDSQVRRQAALSLGQLQLEGETLGNVAWALIQRLRDEDSQVRRQVVLSLGQLQLKGETLAKVAWALIQRLRDKDREVRWAVAYSLREFQLEGETLAEVAGALIQRLGDDDRDVREVVAYSIGKPQLAEETMERVADALVQRLGDPYLDIRRQAALSLGQLQLEGKTLMKAAEALIQTLGNEDRFLRRKAAESLGQLQLEGGTLTKVTKALIQSLGDEDSSVLNAAAGSLEKFQLEGEMLAKVAEALIRRLGHKDRDVRKAVVRSIGQLQLEGELLAKVGEALIRRLGDKDRDVQKAVVRSIGQLQLEGETLGKVGEALIQRLEDNDSFVRSANVEFFQSFLDIKKACAQIRSNEKTAIKLIAYKIFLSETLCYYQEGCFYYYDQGRLSEPIEMDEEDYRKLERFLQAKLLAIG